MFALRTAACALPPHAKSPLSCAIALPLSFPFGPHRQVRSPSFLLLADILRALDDTSIAGRRGLPSSTIFLCGVWSVRRLAIWERKEGEPSSYHTPRDCCRQEYGWWWWGLRRSCPCWCVSSTYVRACLLRYAAAVGQTRQVSGWIDG